jgi:hypothetical protein
MTYTPIDDMYQEFKKIDGYLETNKEQSYRNTINRNYRKALLLSIASYYETRIISELKHIVTSNTNGKNIFANFIYTMCLERTYYRLFTWSDTTGNSFFVLFGTEFRDFMMAEVSKDANLNEGIAAFTKLGKERNDMVHNDFCTYQLQKTEDEIYKLYEKSNYFIDNLPSYFKKFIDS